MSVECRKCKSSTDEASDRGAYLSRVNQKGLPGIWECSPSCESTGNQNDALRRAIGDIKIEENK